MFESLEITEVIYDNDTVGTPDLRITENQQPCQHTGCVSVKNRKHRAAEVCLCLLCFLLLIAVRVLCVCFTNERKQLLTRISNLTEESKLRKDQQVEPLKWIYYNFRFYYISSEKKSWSDSRRDCQQKGADLVIVNKDGEQEFLQNVAKNEYFWIGLINTEEGWKWINGTKTPTGSGTDNCAAVGAKANFRFSCDITQRYICQRIC
ncbi:hypothetical protein QQF64_002558 [Cirrhinus molitorella]|uniref:C-type lectin domain-containing protein n=1 Tax=Cirrhinus molitorella TaxID=172907 RepID=A0ABR3MQG6_9TELE